MAKRGSACRVQRFRAFAKDEEWPRVAKRRSWAPGRLRHDGVVRSRPCLDGKLRCGIGFCTQLKRLGLKVQDLAVVRAERMKSASDLPRRLCRTEVRMSLELVRTSADLLAEIERQNERSWWSA